MAKPQVWNWTHRFNENDTSKAPLTLHVITQFMNGMKGKHELWQINRVNPAVFRAGCWDQQIGPDTIRQATNILLCKTFSFLFNMIFWKTSTFCVWHFFRLDPGKFTATEKAAPVWLIREIIARACRELDLSLSQVTWRLFVSRALASERERQLAFPSLAVCTRRTSRSR